VSPAAQLARPSAFAILPIMENIAFGVIAILLLVYLVVAVLVPEKF